MKCFQNIFFAIALWSTALFSIEEEGFFSSQEIAGILNHSYQKEDLIVLHDGTQLYGKIPKLPELRYFFGNIPIGIEEGAAIAFANEKKKMQVITRDGQCLIGKMPHERVILVQNFSSSDSNIEQEIDPHTIKYILFKKRKESSLSTSLYALVLKNGDQIPVTFAEDHIQLNDGWKEFSLQTHAIKDLHFDGGLYGKLEDEQGNLKELDYAFVKDTYLRVNIGGGSQKLGIPWDQISAIREEKMLQDDEVGVHFAQKIFLEPQKIIDEEEEKREIAMAFFLELELTRSQMLQQALHQMTVKTQQQFQCLEEERAKNLAAQEEIEQMQLVQGELYADLLDRLNAQKEQNQVLQKELSQFNYVQNRETEEDEETEGIALQEEDNGEERDEEEGKLLELFSAVKEQCQVEKAYVDEATNDPASN